MTIKDFNSEIFNDLKGTQQSVKMPTERRTQMIPPLLMTPSSDESEQIIIKINKGKSRNYGYSDPKL